MRKKKYIKFEKHLKYILTYNKKRITIYLQKFILFTVNIINMVFLKL